MLVFAERKLWQSTRSRKSQEIEWYKALDNGDDQRVAYLLDEYPYLIRLTSEQRLPPLHFAASQGFVKIVDELLTVDYNLIHVRESEYQGTALHFAASRGCDQVVQQLLAVANHEIIHAATRYGWTALHLAATNGHEKVVSLLLAASPSLVRATDRAGGTALHHAAHGGQTHIVEQLLTFSPDLIDAVDKDGLTALHYALFRRVGDQHATLCKFMIANSSRGQIVAKLLTANHNLANVVNSTNVTPLHTAIINWEADWPDDVFTQLLAASPASINAVDQQQDTSLHLAAENGEAKLISWVLANIRPNLVVAINDSGNTALHSALKKGNEAVARLLLATNPELISKLDSSKNTPLHLALEASPSLIKKLWELDQGAFNSLNQDDCTPFDSCLLRVLNNHPKSEDKIELPRAAEVLQWGLSFEHLVGKWAHCPRIWPLFEKRWAEKQLTPVMEMQHAALAVFLGRDVVRTVCDYLGFSGTFPNFLISKEIFVAHRFSNALHFTF